MTWGLSAVSRRASRRGRGSGLSSPVPAVIRSARHAPARSGCAHAQSVAFGVREADGDGALMAEVAPQAKHIDPVEGRVLLPGKAHRRSSRGGVIDEEDLGAQPVAVKGAVKLREE